MLKLPATDLSYWQETYKKPQYPELVKDLDVDIVIIGAGITGLTSGYLLKQAGYKVVVIDKSTVGGGTTGRTTGKVTSQHNLVYQDLQKRLGNDVAQVYADANQAAVELIESIVKQEKIDCEWQRKDNYVYTANPKKIELLRQEAEVATSLGLPASFESSAILPFKTLASVKFNGQSKINAQKYLLGLAEYVKGNGSYVFENSSVHRIMGGKRCYVKTKRAKIRAKNIIIATNVPAFPLLARGTYCLFEYPKESYIVAGITTKKLDGMYISPDKNNYSILPAEIDGVKHILIGGEGHFSAFRYNRAKRFQKLADYAEKQLGVTEITHKWSDRDYLGYDGVPLVGPLYPWSKNIFVGTAFKKWGLSNGTAAAMILKDLIMGKENTWASTYYPHRLRLITSIPRVIMENIRGNH